MEIHVNDRFLLLGFENKDEEVTIKDFLTYQDASNAFMGGSFDKRRIKNHCFLKKVKSKENFYMTYSGFLREVVVFAREKNITITKIKDERTKYPHQIKDFEDEYLRKFFDPKFTYVDHQIRALRALLKSNTAIYKATTGSGKTETFIALIKIINEPTLILVNKVTLALQTRARMMKNGLDCGVVTGKGIQRGFHMVATIGSVKKVPDLTKYKVLVIDEAHRAQAKQFQEFLEQTSYPLRFGFSATPEGNNEFDFAKLRQFLGSIVVEVEAKELLHNKVIVRPKIKMIPVECPPTLDWPSANEKCIVYNEDRNKIIRNLIEDHDLPTLVLIRNIEHGEILQNLIPGSVFLSGVNDADEREEVIEKFENREIKTLISSNILNEGISIDVIRLLIIASGGKSSIEVVQKIGRALRNDEGKKEALVFDFHDYNNRFTEKHSQIRESIYRKIGYDVIE